MGAGGTGLARGAICDGCAGVTRGPAGVVGEGFWVDGASGGWMDGFGMG